MQLQGHEWLPPRVQLPLRANEPCSSNKPGEAEENARDVRHRADCAADSWRETDTVNSMVSSSAGARVDTTDRKQCMAPYQNDMKKLAWLATLTQAPDFQGHRGRHG